MLHFMWFSIFTGYSWILHGKTFYKMMLEKEYFSWNWMR